MQNTLTSLLYLIQDYDCISPGTVPYCTVMYQKMVPYGTVWYDTYTVPYGRRLYYYYFFFLTICPLLTAVVGRSSQPTTAVHIYNLPSYR